MNRLAPREWGLVAAAGALLADQTSKLFILYGLGFHARGDHTSVAVLPFFNLTMDQNSGISFGAFSGHGALGTAVLVALSLAAIVGMSWWLWNTNRLGLCVGLGLIVGGALGNLIDRLANGSVTDFIKLPFWPAFNVSDIAITSGVLALLWVLEAPSRRTPRS